MRRCPMLCRWRTARAPPSTLSLITYVVAGVLGGEQQQVDPAGADRVLEADQHLVEERVLQVGVALAGLEEDADDVRALGDEAAGRGGRGVVELAREADDALAG